MAPMLDVPWPKPPSEMPEIKSHLRRGSGHVGTSVGHWQCPVLSWSMYTSGKLALVILGGKPKPEHPAVGDDDGVSRLQLI